MGKNYIIALVLMTVVIGIWMLIIIPRSTQNYPQKKISQTKQEKTSESRRTPPRPKVNMATKNTAKDNETKKPVTEITNPGKRILVDTNYYKAEFSEKEAIARSWKLKKYKRRDERNELFNLIPSSALNCLAVKFIDGGLQLKASNSIWKADRSKVTLDGNSDSKSITFSEQVGDDLELLKKFTFHNNSYIVDLDLSFYNKSTNKFTALSAKDESGDSGYMLCWGPGIPSDNLPGGKIQKRRGSHNGAKVLTIENKVKKGLKKEEARTPVKWVSFENQYFVASMIPEPNLEPEYRRESARDVVDAEEKGIVAETEVASLMIPGFILEPGQKKTNHFRLYIGPKNNGLLKKVTIPGTEEPAKLNKVINFGIFGFLAIIMLWLLNISHKVIPNYGVATIFLTLLTKVVVYPLTRKSYKSMKKMQELQPQMKELQEKYRDDPKKLNKAVMRLYKEHGANPMSGCIPWLPQLPIFWALISTLRNSIELRGAGFIPYLASDLSAPSDALFSVLGMPIRILPLLNIGATFLQQKITGAGAAGAAGTQNKFMKYLPLLFVLIFYNWAAGFILYWLFNNIFITVEQYIVNKKSNGTEKVKSK